MILIMSICHLPTTSYSFISLRGLTGISLRCLKDRSTSDLLYNFTWYSIEWLFILTVNHIYIVILACVLLFLHFKYCAFSCFLRFYFDHVTVCIRAFCHVHGRSSPYKVVSCSRKIAIFATRKGKGTFVLGARNPQSFQNSNYLTFIWFNNICVK